MTMTKTTAEVDSSSEATKEAGVCCASCDIAGVDNNESEECTECHSTSTRYCGDDNCRGEHREQHEEECKERADELRDKNLFSQPDGSYPGECPLCFLPLPLDSKSSGFYSCCSKVICNGCVYAHHKSNGGDRCPFCRERVASKEENRKRLMKRVKANDPIALREMGILCYREGDYDTAFEILTKAVELGDAVAHFMIGKMYWQGQGVEKDEEKSIHHYEKAAIGGHHNARYVLGYVEGLNGNIERAVKHFVIAAKLGCVDSMKMLWVEFKDGNVTKEDLEATLRTHQAAIDETKSEQRDRCTGKGWGSFS